MHGLWRRLRGLNRTLAPDRQIRLIGLDVEQFPAHALAHLVTLLPDRAAPSDVAPLVESIKDTNRRAIDGSCTLSEWQDLALAWRDAVNEHRDDFTSLLGDQFLDFQLTVNSCAASVEMFAAGSLKTQAGMTIRDKQMFENFLDVRAAYPNAKFYGHFGGHHVVRQPMKTGTPTLASYMDSEGSPVFGKVVSIHVGYVDSEAITYDRNTGTYKPRHVDSMLCPAGWERFGGRDGPEVVLFRLTGPGSPYLESPIFNWLQGSGTQNFQFLMLVRHAKAATPLAGGH